MTRQLSDEEYEQATIVAEQLVKLASSPAQVSVAYEAVLLHLSGFCFFLGKRNKKEAVRALLHITADCKRYINDLDDDEIAQTHSGSDTKQ